MNTALANMASSTIAEAVHTTTEGSGGGANLLDFNYTFILVAFNLLVLYYVLNKLLFSKITPFLEKRAATIKASLDEAEKAKLYAEGIREEYAQKIKQAQGDIQKMIEEARLSAIKESEEIVKNAKNEASQIFDKAKEEIQKEKEKMVREIKKEAASIALSAASKIIEANVDNETNKKLVEKFINEVGVA